MEHSIGLLHPGNMGSSVGASARLNGAEVLWASEGRSDQTRRRAEAAGLSDSGSLDALVHRSQVILGICPPHAAVDLARSVAGRDHAGIYVDANAVSPVTSREVQRIVEAAGASFVDGGIIGPPALSPGTTRLYLSGAEAPNVAALFREGPLDAIVLDGPPGAASALKIAYAAYTKGSAALFIAIRTLAIHEGVDTALLREWRLSLPEMPGVSAEAVRECAPKAWRFRGEMEEIADTFAGAGLPEGFHRAAADIYRRMAGYKDTDIPPTVEDAARRILADDHNHAGGGP